ncbi:MAG: SEL1-like repeat protein, partial [Firmicutes bacterium]|nr:SEL1-like repeat protein [Bacillota bacterium]
RGDVLACANLGWCCETGQGTEKDLKQALRYYWEGATRGEEHCVEAVKRLSDPAAEAKAH